MVAMKALVLGTAVALSGCTVKLIQPPAQTPINLTVVLPETQVTAPTTVNNHTTIQPEAQKEATAAATQAPIPPVCPELATLIAEPAFDVSPYEEEADPMRLLKASLQRIARYDRTLQGVELNGRCKEETQ